MRSLSPAAFKVLVYVAKLCYGAEKNGRIGFGARSGCIRFDPASRRDEEVPIGLTKSAVADGLDELQRHGLLRCTKESSFGQKQVVREWRLTWRPFVDEKGQKQPPTNEFLYFSLTDLAVERPSTKDFWLKNKSQSSPADYVEPDSPPQRTGTVN